MNISHNPLHEIAFHDQVTCNFVLLYFTIWNGSQPFLVVDKKIYCQQTKKMTTYFKEWKDRQGYAKRMMHIFLNFMLSQII